MKHASCTRGGIQNKNQDKCTRKFTAQKWHALQCISNPVRGPAAFLPVSIFSTRSWKHYHISPKTHCTCFKSIAICTSNNYTIYQNERVHCGDKLTQACPSSHIKTKVKVDLILLIATDVSPATLHVSYLQISSTRNIHFAQRRNWENNVVNIHWSNKPAQNY